MKHICQSSHHTSYIGSCTSEYHHMGSSGWDEKHLTVCGCAQSYLEPINAPPSINHATKVWRRMTRLHTSFFLLV